MALESDYLDSNSNSVAKYLPNLGEDFSACQSLHFLIYLVPGQQSAFNKQNITEQASTHSQYRAALDIPLHPDVLVFSMI